MPVPLGGRIQSAKLPTDCRIIDKGTSVIVAGTGPVTLDPHAVQEFQLRQIVTKTISWTECKTTLIKDVREMNQTEFICANVIDGQTIYEGDSGKRIQQFLISQNGSANQ